MWGWTHFGESGYPTRGGEKYPWEWLAGTLEHQSCPRTTDRPQIQVSPASPVAPAPAWASSATWPKVTAFFQSQWLGGGGGSAVVSLLSILLILARHLAPNSLQAFLEGRGKKLLLALERLQRRREPGRAEQPRAAVARSAEAPGTPSGRTRAVWRRDLLAARVQRPRGCRWPWAGIC